MLALAKIEEWHHGGFLILGRVSLEDLVDQSAVLFGEFEGNGGVIFGCVAVLGHWSDWVSWGKKYSRHTTERDSLRLEEVDEKGRVGLKGALDALDAHLNPCRRDMGTNFDEAMVAVIIVLESSSAK